MVGPPPEANCFHSFLPSVALLSSGARTSRVMFGQGPPAAAWAALRMLNWRVPGTTWQVLPSPPLAVGPQAGSTSWLSFWSCLVPSPGMLPQFRSVEFQVLFTGWAVRYTATGVSEPDAAQSSLIDRVADVTVAPPLPLPPLVPPPSTCQS